MVSLRRILEGNEISTNLTDFKRLATNNHFYSSICLVILQC